MATPLTDPPPSVHKARKRSPEGDDASVGLEGKGSGVVTVIGFAAASVPPEHCAALLGLGSAAAASQDPIAAALALAPSMRWWFASTQ
jgi:hypothetical protein